MAGKKDRAVVAVISDLTQNQAAQCPDLSYPVLKLVKNHYSYHTSYLKIYLPEFICISASVSACVKAL